MLFQKLTLQVRVGLRVLRCRGRRRGYELHYRHGAGEHCEQQPKKRTATKFITQCMIQPQL